MITSEITVNLFWIVFTVLIGIIVFLLHNYGGVKLFINKDREITTKFLDKFPLVSPVFIQKNQKEQIIENNQEIHELNKQIQDVQDTNNKILYLLSNTNILQSMTLDEVKKNNG